MQVADITTFLNETICTGEKAAQCKTSGELIALLGEWGNEIPDELVEAIAGGRMLDGILLADEDHHVDISPEVLSILRKSGSTC